MWAQDSLGDLLFADGDVEGAREAYEQAIDSGHPRWSPIARIDLAVLLADGVDDLAGAAGTWRSRLRPPRPTWLRPRT